MSDNLATEVLIIGAGVIGVAIARSLSKAGVDCVLIEKHARCGTGASSRNSEVIHAGVYYAPSSLKATLCCQGKRLLYDYAKKYELPVARVGKLFISLHAETDSDLDRLKSLGQQNGLDNLVELDQKQVHRLEPELICSAALYSPDSGIIDSASFIQTMLQEAIEQGLIYAPKCEFSQSERVSGTWISSVGGNSSVKLKSRFVINAAGKEAIPISQQQFPDCSHPRNVFNKGCYLAYDASPPTKMIVYPSLAPGIITERVDATPSLKGAYRFGPSIDAAKNANDYSIPNDLRERFLPTIKKYLPNIQADRLRLDTAGLRPKIQISGSPVEDFFIDWGPEEKWLNLFGMESPGLTASQAVGEYVTRLVQNNI